MTECCGEEYSLYDGPNPRFTEYDMHMIREHGWRPR